MKPYKPTGPNGRAFWFGFRKRKGKEARPMARFTKLANILTIALFIPPSFAPPPCRGQSPDAQPDPPTTSSVPPPRPFAGVQRPGQMLTVARSTSSPSPPQTLTPTPTATSDEPAVGQGARNWPAPLPVTPADAISARPLDQTFKLKAAAARVDRPSLSDQPGDGVKAQRCPAADRGGRAGQRVGGRSRAHAGQGSLGPYPQHRLRLSPARWRRP